MRPPLKIRLRGRQRSRLQRMFDETGCPRTRIRVQLVLLADDGRNVPDIARPVDKSFARLARAPIAGGILLALGRTDTGRANFALLPARHPGAGQSWEQTQFGFIFNVDIGSGWRMS